MSDSAFTLKFKAKDHEAVQRALRTEWLLTNGIGGYAMGTALGANTRRYHGLLIAATKPPVGRMLAIHSCIEQLVVGDEVFDLSTHQFGDEFALHPNGWQHLVEFRCVPNQRVEWKFNVNGVRVHKSLSMLDGRNGIALQYLVSGQRSLCTLRLRPLVPLRDFHGLERESASHPQVDFDHHGIVHMQHNEHTLRWFGQSKVWRSDPQWWRHFAYELDRQRGQDHREDLWSPGLYECEIAADREARIGFAIAMQGGDVIQRRASAQAPSSSNVVGALHDAADQFIVQRKLGETWSTSVIAGYPWFGDWGRDTMISLPGLMIATNRLDEAQSTLLTFAKNLRHGLIPNLFDDYGGAAHYNTVDASLWFVHAVHELWKVTQAIDDTLLNACREIVHAYSHGTDFNIRMDDDGLITAGDENTQLTWMDAKRDGVVFTPRHGKAVEINALWFHALNCLAHMIHNDMERRDYIALTEKVTQSFRETFWWEERKCLRDVVYTPETASEQLRPNQIFAASLPFSPLDEPQQRAVVKTVGDRLLTPFGLRTLDRDDPNYKRRYEGGMFKRDRAYHNGTVWPWLIGPYCEALLRINKFNAASRRKVRAILQPLLDEMNNTDGGRCIGQIAEVYDGDPPHRPSGCPAQAWSIAETLRILMLLENSPRKTQS